MSHNITTIYILKSISVESGEPDEPKSIVENLDCRMEVNTRNMITYLCLNAVILCAYLIFAVTTQLLSNLYSSRGRNSVGSG